MAEWAVDSNGRAAGFHDSRWLVFAILVKIESITQLKGFLKHKGPPRFSDCSLLLQSKQRVPTAANNRELSPGSAPPAIPALGRLRRH